MVGPRTAGLLQGSAVAYAVLALGAAAVWAVHAGAVTVRTARTGLPFALTWWSFTFPVGTCVTGLSGLALATHSSVLGAAAVTLFAALVGVWLVVAARTWHAGAVRGALFA